MTTWIFQANPDHYDIDEAFAVGVSELLYTVSRQAKEMKEGDQVFIWRSKGRSGRVSGVIAETTMIAEPTVASDSPESRQFWTDPTRAVKPKMRAALRVDRVADKNQTLLKDWLVADPVLRDLSILKTPNSTNFKVPEEQAKRLNHLWTMTGTSWTRDECIAGLWAFQQTMDGPISKLTESPVAEIAMLIGRAVPSVYNKVMNFRSLDPNDPRKGMTAGGQTTAAVWNEFYRSENNSLDINLLDAEFVRLWRKPNYNSPILHAKTAAKKSIETAERLVKTMTLEELEQVVAARFKKTTGKPAKKHATTTIFERDPLLVALRKLRAENKCEVPDCVYPPFIAKNGLPYSEVHHIVPLSDGGADTLENMITLCPAHHVAAHRGRESNELMKKFEKIRKTYN